MVVNKKKVIALFRSTFILSACTFGGGFVIVPLMRKRFVQDLGWIEEDEMLDLTAIAQSCPGAIAVNASILVGYRVAGIIGALVSVLGTVLPPLIIISGISIFYRAFRENPFVNMTLSGMLCGVAAVIFDVVIRMIKDIVDPPNLLSLVIIIGAFLAVRLFSVNIIMIILTCGAIGVVETVLSKKRRDKGRS